MKRSFQLPNSNKLSPVKKLMLGFAGASTVAIVGTAGMAAAQQFHPPTSPTIPTSKDDCKNGGWQHLGFKNQGQCIAAFNHSHGHGYGQGDENDNDNDQGENDNSQGHGNSHGDQEHNQENDD